MDDEISQQTSNEARQQPEGSIASLEERSMLVDGQRWLSAVTRSTAEGGELEPQLHRLFLA